MPSSRRTLRRRKRLRADMEPAPTVNGRVCDQPGNRNLVAPQTHVGDDACIVPHTPRHRKRPGRDKSRPYKPSEHDRPNRTGATTPATVGRDALIPPDPAAAQIPTGGYGIRPYETAGAAGGYGTRPCTGFRRFSGAGEGSAGTKI